MEMGKALNINKTCGTHQGRQLPAQVVFKFRLQKEIAAEPASCSGQQSGWSVYVCGNQPAARLQSAPGLAEETLLQLAVDVMGKHGVNRDVEKIIGKVELFRNTYPELRGAFRDGGFFPSDGDHFWGCVDADDLFLSGDSIGNHQGQGAGAAADIQHPVSRLKLQQRHGFGPETLLPAEGKFFDQRVVEPGNMIEIAAAGCWRDFSKAHGS